MAPLDLSITNMSEAAPFIDMIYRKAERLLCAFPNIRLSRRHTALGGYETSIEPRQTVPDDQCYYQDQSPFFRLPAEVRNMVYEALFYVQPEPFECGISVWAVKYFDSFTLLRACRRTHDEARHVFWRLNRIDLFWYAWQVRDDHEPFELHPAQRAAVTQLSLNSDLCMGLPVGFDYLNELFPNIRSLYLRHTPVFSIHVPSRCLSPQWATQTGVESIVRELAKLRNLTDVQITANMDPVFRTYDDKQTTPKLLEEIEQEITHAFAERVAARRLRIAASCTTSS